jgi:GDP-L-fucose synthase
MKIAVLGANGFIGRNLYQHLNKNHIVTAYTRSNLNLLDLSETTKELNKNKFDLIINAAASMTNNETLFDTRNNLTIFMNFFTRSNYFGKFLNLGTGAEYDRRQSINSFKEQQIFDSTPVDSYGYSQNIKTRLTYEKDNFFGLKIFNCFGKDEKQTRIFPQILNNKIFILEDRYFDFFYIKDLLTVIDSHIENNIQYKDMNCVYEKKIKISEAIEKFCEFNKLKVDINKKEVKELNYTGNPDRIKNLKLDLFGLERSLKEYNL